MKRIQTAWVAVFAMAGCHTLPHWAGGSNELVVGVKNHETDESIVGATVRLTNSALIPMSGTTDQSGTARFDHAPLDDGELFAEVSAPGYLTEWHSVSSTGPGVVVKVGLYADPRPKAELILPAGFKGRIDLRFQKSFELSLDPEPIIMKVPRQYSVACSAEGVAVLEYSAILHHLGPLDVTATFADGAPMPAIATDGDTGFRWAKSTERTLYFVVGTMAECKDYRRALEGVPERFGGSGSGDGKPSRGGGGRRGGGGGGRGGR